METKVTFIYDYKNIELPEPLTKIAMPQLDDFVEFQCQALAQSKSKIELAEGQTHVLTDEMVQEEALPGVETVEQYKEAIKAEVPRVIVSEQGHMILMNYLMPNLVERSTFEINDEEATRESEERFHIFEENAKEQGMTIVELGQKEYGAAMDEGEIRQLVLRLGRTQFLFRVLAKEYLKRQGQVFDLASYAHYVKELSEVSGMPEEQVRELVPLHVYMTEVPALVMLDEMAAWLEPQIQLTTEEAEDSSATN